jgi:hypothetical protein
LEDTPMVFGNINGLLSPAAPVTMSAPVQREQEDEGRRQKAEASQPPVRATDPAGIRGRMVDISV